MVVVGAEVTTDCQLDCELTQVDFPALNGDRNAVRLLNKTSSERSLMLLQSQDKRFE